MHRVFSIVTAVGFLWAGVSGAPEKPDFSGVWALDGSRSEDRGVYGQMRVIMQGPAEISMAVLHVASGRISITPWRLAFDRWRPRRGGDQSLEPIVQSRWDGNQLVTLKAPGTHYSVLWIWTLSADGAELTSDAISTGIGSSFDFKVTSAPHGYIPDRHIYTRVASPKMPVDQIFSIRDREIVWNPTTADAPVALRLVESASSLEVTCATTSCAVTDIVSGRRGLSRSLATGGTATVSLKANSVIEPATGFH